MTRPCHRRHATRNRAGVTLLEVIFATGLFAGALAILLPASDRGAAVAMRAQMESLAAIECQNVLSRTLAEGESGQRSALNSTYYSSLFVTVVSMEASPWPGVALVTAETKTLDPQLPYQYSLSRLIAQEARP